MAAKEGRGAVQWALCRGCSLHARDVHSRWHVHPHHPGVRGGIPDYAAGKQHIINNVMVFLRNPYVLQVLVWNPIGFVWNLHVLAEILVRSWWNPYVFWWDRAASLRNSYVFWWSPIGFLWNFIMIDEILMLPYAITVLRMGQLACRGHCLWVDALINWVFTYSIDQLHN